MHSNTRRRVTAFGLRFMTAGVAALLLLGLAGRRAGDDSEAEAAAPAKRKYVLLNIYSKKEPSGNLSWLKEEFSKELEKKYGDLLVETEDLEWVNWRDSKNRGSSDLVTINADDLQLVIRCAGGPDIKAEPYWSPKPPVGCPHRRRMKCLEPLPLQLRDYLWTHERMHRSKSK